jgi:hypothetical protein
MTNSPLFHQTQIMQSLEVLQRNAFLSTFPKKSTIRHHPAPSFHNGKIFQKNPIFGFRISDFGFQLACRMVRA